MAVTKKYATDIVWGTSTAGASPAGGKVLGARKKHGAKFFEQEDGDGELYSLVVHDLTKELELEVLVAGTVTLPAIGDKATVSTVDYVVMGVDEIWASKAAKKLSLSLKKWEAAGTLA
jgi:hypothetical protein